MKAPNTIKDIFVFGQEIIDEKCIEQLKNCYGEEDIAVLTADAHYGYHHPIGGAIAYRNFISVSGVGFDIACGNKAVKTNIRWDDLKSMISSVMTEVYNRISFGMGRPNDEPVDHPVLDQIAHANLTGQRDMLQLATAQLGTVGGGNHFVDLFVDQGGWVWIGVHFGSRGLGHKTASGFIALSQGLKFTDRGKEGSMDSKPVLLHKDSVLGQDYIEGMRLAGEYAYAGRDVVVDKVLEIIGGKSTLEIHNHHNFAWKEKHNGDEYWVVRKGCTPAFPGQLGFIGANMLDTSVIIEGVDSQDSRDGLYSTVHGAGRVMSRTQAAGKKKWKRGEDGKKRPVVVGKGLVDFDQVKAEMKSKHVELRGAGPDEAPQCYKKLTEVLEYHKGTIDIKYYLNPVGVAMAGDEYDPYKD